MSNGLAGYVAETNGYDSAFLVLAAVAGCAVLLLLGMPETLKVDATTAELDDAAPRPTT